MTELNIPEFVANPGQSGSGKSTITRIMAKWCENKGKRVLAFGSGDLLREYAQRNTSLGREVRKTLNHGDRLPLPFTGELIRDYIRENQGKYDHFFLHGTPRYVEHCDMIYDFMAKDDYVRSVMILEPLAPDHICRPRIVERTKQDKREDLSVDGHPGVPDDAKIDRKMRWWTDVEDTIRTRAQKLGIYQSVRNDQDEIFLKNQLCELFT